MNYSKLKSLVLIFSTISAVIFLQGCVPAVIGGTAVAAKVISDPRTIGTQIDDETLEERVLAKLNKDPQLKKYARLNVVSYNNRILLIGQVPNQALKNRATKIAASVEYVREVFNYLAIGPNLSAGRILKDSWITSKAKSELLITKGVKSPDIKVITENGIVYLMGEVTPIEAQIAVNVVRKIDGVKKVIVLFQYITLSNNL